MRRVHPDYPPRTRLERGIASARIVLALGAAVAVLFDRSSPAFHTILTAYLFHSVFVLALVWSPVRFGSTWSLAVHAGDLLVVDWGAAWDGYISDLTRTFAVEDVDEECRRIHKIVQEANAAGRAAAKPGVPCANVDQAARAVIEQGGYGMDFTHRTGHGIGMEGHEEPYMRGDNLQLLEPGMAFTVEPGIYLPDRNGVRIEDNVVITDIGADVLSDMPREIRTVG